MPITIEVVDPASDHIIIRSDEPCRIELSLLGAIIAHAYRGVTTDLDQEPDAVYDGTVPQRPYPLPMGIIQAEARDE